MKNPGINSVEARIVSVCPEGRQFEGSNLGAILQNNCGLQLTVVLINTGHRDYQTNNVLKFCMVSAYVRQEWGDNWV